MTPSAVDLIARLARGEVSSREVVDACLQRIAERDGTVRAFVHLDPDYARAQADRLDQHRKAGRPIGRLHGLPVALKDIIDTRDYPTENGTPLDAGRRPASDASVAARLRAAGAVILGKTVTTEFAFMQPGPTTNPHDPARTPGGSSQGSAAAVAAGMVPIAYGTQTAGSVIRPASFCGDVGYKPSHGAVPLTGVLAICEPLDTIGAFAGTLEDAALAIEVVAGADGVDHRVATAPVPRLVEAACELPPLTPRLAIVRGPTFGRAGPDLAGLFDELETTLADVADRVDLPEPFDNAWPAHRKVMTVGFARNLRPYRARGEDAVSEVMRAAMDEGAAISAADYLAALDWKAALNGGLGKVFERYDAIVTPAAPGEAPEGLDSTGDAAFNAMWTFLGTPCVTLPLARGSNGLPIGIQLVGRVGEDARLLRVANWFRQYMADR